MCGCYALAGNFSAFTTEFNLEEVPGLTSRYNIAPSSAAGHEAPILTPQGLIFARFWYIPSFFMGPLSRLPTSFNARIETVLDKPFFRGAAPCLVPTSGFREFQGPKGKKTAVCFYVPPHSPDVDRASLDQVDTSAAPETGAPATSFFAFAGIASTWTDSETGEQADTFAIVTTEPNDVVRPYHDRMPLVVPAEQHQNWLTPNQDLSVLLQAAHDVASETPLQCYEATTLGNSTRVEGPEYIRPGKRQLSLF